MNITYDTIINLSVTELQLLHQLENAKNTLVVYKSNKREFNAVQKLVKKGFVYCIDNNVLYKRNPEITTNENCYRKNY